MEDSPTAFPNLPQSLSGLETIASNLWWSWHPEARMLYKRLNRQAWKESGHNPFKMLGSLPPEIFSAAAGPMQPRFTICSNKRWCPHFIGSMKTVFRKNGSR